MGTPTPRLLFLNMTLAKEKILVIINPISGTSSKVSIPSKLQEAFQDREKELFITYTKQAGHATHLVQEAHSLGFSSIIAVGGDGTINEIAAAMAETTMTLGIIPMGSGNGLARSLGISMNEDKAIETILNNHVIEIDGGTANGKPFFATFGMGFDAEVTKKYDDNSFRGPLSYVFSTIDEFFNHKPNHYRIHIGNEVIEQDAFLITCANACQYGNNAYIAPNAKMNDGVLDLVVVSRISPLAVPQFALQLFTKRINKNTSIDVYRSDQFLIERESEGAIQVDGESGEMGQRIEIKIRPGVLNVYASIDDSQPAVQETLKGN